MNNEILSRAEEYVISKGWKYDVSNKELRIEICPFCGKDNQHFGINKETEESGCLRCHKGSRTLLSLKRKLGDYSPDQPDLPKPTKATAIDPKQIERQHNVLMTDDDVLDYLVVERGFTVKVIKEQKLGVTEKTFRKLGTVKALCIPYFRNGKPIFVKYRTLPPEKKDFISTEIEDLPLYNEDCLRKDMDELLLVEGEADALAAMSAGYTSVVGVPGAGSKKAEWIFQLDSIAPKKIYLCYDTDEPGKTGAKELAQRIGLDKVNVIMLPEFEKHVGEGKGKDLNEFLRRPNGYAEFLALKEKATPLPIDGVFSMVTVLDSLKEKFIRGDDPLPEFDSPWPSLTKITGRFNRGDVIGITAPGKTGKTSLALNWLNYYAKKGYSTFMYCMEMQQESLTKRWMSCALGKPETRLEKQIIEGTEYDIIVPNFTIADFDLAEKIRKRFKNDIVLGWTKFDEQRPDDVFETIYQTKRRYGTDVFVFDNLHYIARSLLHRTEEMDRLSKKFKQIAQELKVLEILLMQPTKTLVGQITTSANARGSVAMTQDVDCGMALSRPPKSTPTMKDLKDAGRLDMEGAYEPKIFFSVDYPRNGPGGFCTLAFQGDIARVSEFEVQ